MPERNFVEKKKYAGSKHGAQRQKIDHSSTKRPKPWPAGGGGLGTGQLENESERGQLWTERTSIAKTGERESTADKKECVFGAKPSPLNLSQYCNKWGYLSFRKGGGARKVG